VIPLQVDGPRLLRRLDALAELGGFVSSAGDRGCTRLALTDADREGRDLVVTWMNDLGLDVRIDEIGNVIATRQGRRDDLAPVMTGSHIDTVRTGGRFDGNLGVLAGLEAVETLATAGLVTRRPIAVAFFTNEEGARFQPDMLGSLVYAGGLALEEALDTTAVDGPRLGHELARIGYQGPAPCPGPSPHAFVELHIEQGPIMEAEGHTIGAVTGVQGISWQELTIAGEANHAGTTPMTMRRDPAFVAAELTVFVRHLALQLGGHQVGTVGQLDLYPNLVNVVPARAVLTVDLRNTDDRVLQEAERRLAQRCRQLEHDEGVTITRRSLARFEPVQFDARVVDLVERTAVALGHRTMRLPSGAGHDAQMMARLCPTGMVFTPSVRGVSHNPAEHTAPADLVAGADVLLQVLVELAESEELPA
jgi:beta-ureidopropionase / N-carbamoyl-L-amino-acid hydrolase